jgi:hypothetical protein
MDLDLPGLKAAVPPGTTTEDAWAGALTSDVLAKSFFEQARRASLFGKIPGLQQIPFRVKVPTLTTDASYDWVGQGLPKPVSAFAFDDGVTLGATKIQGTVVVTEELARIAVPGLEKVLETLLTNGLTIATDKMFLDPAIGVVPDVHPPSITNGLTPIAGTGDLAKDLATLVAAVYTGRPLAERVAVIVPPAMAAQLTSTTVPLGVDLVTSAAAGALGIAVALDPSGVFVADVGIQFNISREALLEMDTAPTGGAAAVLVSLFECNLAGYRVERFVNWQPLPGAVAYMTVTTPATSAKRGATR